MAKTKTNIELTRVNINLPTSLVDKVKEYADNTGINVTSAFIVLLNQAIEYKDALTTLPFIFDALKNIEVNKEEDK